MAQPPDSKRISGYKCPRCGKPTVSYVERSGKVIVFCEDEQCKNSFQVNKEAFKKNFNDYLEPRRAPKSPTKKPKAIALPGPVSTDIVKSYKKSGRLAKFFKRSKKSEETAAKELPGSTTTAIVPVEQKTTDIVPTATPDTEEKESEKKPFNCSNCNAWIYEYPCFQCGHDPRKKKDKEKGPSFRGITGKRVKSRIYEALISVFIGIFMVAGLPFFGLPPFNLIGIAFIIFIPAYILLINQHDFLETATEEEGSVVSLKSYAGGTLIVKSVCKLIAYVLILIDIFAFNRLITLIVAFFFYFTLPMRYKTSQPSKAIEAWARLVFGIFLAFLFYSTFGGSTAGFLPTVGNVVANSLFWMGLAFFAVLPYQEEANDETRISINFYKNLTDSNAFKWIEWLLFSILMIMALGSFTSWFTLIDTGVMQMIFYALWVLSLIVGLTTGPEAKPAMGILTILVALLIFSSTYTGVVGEAIFGYWWPQVQSFTDTTLAPLTDMWNQAQTGMGDVWLMITNPQAYIDLQERRRQVTRSTPTGTKDSIEVDKFKLYSTRLDPSKEVLSVDINLKNKGEFDADYIRLELEAFWKNPNPENPKFDEVPVGSVTRSTCSGLESTNSNYCEWRGDPDSDRPAAYPDEAVSASFDFSKEWNADGTDLGECCLLFDEEGNDLECEENIQPCQIDTSYVHSGETVKIRAKYYYDYNVNVSMPIEVIPKGEFDDLMRAGEITQKEVTSEYTGGPVKATIYSREQPVKNGEESFVRVALYNEGNGNITSIESFTIIVPSILKPENIDIDSSTFTGCTSWEPYDEDGEFDYAICDYLPYERPEYPPIERDKYRMAAFLIHPEDVLYTRETSLIVGIASYSYVSTTDRDIQIATGPFG